MDITGQLLHRQGAADFSIYLIKDRLATTLLPARPKVLRMGTAIQYPFMVETMPAPGAHAPEGTEEPPLQPAS